MKWPCYFTLTRVSPDGVICIYMSYISPHLMERNWAGDFGPCTSYFDWDCNVCQSFTGLCHSMSKRKFEETDMDNEIAEDEELGEGVSQNGDEASGSENVEDEILSIDIQLDEIGKKIVSIVALLCKTTLEID